MPLSRSPQDIFRKKKAMDRDLSRLLNPRSIAVIGGGAWCASIIKAAETIGYDGEIFPVHPEGKVIAGRQAVRTLADWGGAD